MENDGLRSFQGAPDWWESARFQAVFLAQAGSGKATFSRPAHPRVTHTVGWLRRVPTYTLDGLEQVFYTLFCRLPTLNEATR